MICPDYYDITYGGLSKFITILHGGGLPDLLQYYKGEGGGSRDPKFVLRNIWTAPNHLGEFELNPALEVSKSDKKLK